jgi:hypothetical protein
LNTTEIHSSTLNLNDSLKKLVKENSSRGNNNLKPENHSDCISLRLFQEFVSHAEKISQQLLEQRRS